MLYLYSTSCLFLFFLIINFKVCNCYLSACEPVVRLNKEPVVKIANFASFTGSATISLKKKRIIFQYLGIPYAIPPVGYFRFKAPVPLGQLNLNYTYDAKSFKSKCPQIVTEEDQMYLKNHSTAEDCLYLNVYTITDEGEHRQPLLPVMIYLHGGGYYQGSALDHCPNYLLDHDMILVTVQYRLGPIGFLNLETEDVSGNMGLLDMLMAIEWVNKNIKYFGGDNKRVTIAGQSSGGTSVSLLLISPLVRPNLFQQAIIQSGNFLGEWSLDFNSRDHALEFATYVNCSQSNLIKLIECLKNVPPYELINANLAYMMDRVVSKRDSVKEIGIAHAVIQKQGTEIFLKEDPRKSLKNGHFLKIPVMTGVTKDEGSMVLEILVDVIVKPALDKLHLGNKNQSLYLKNEFFEDFLTFNGISKNYDYLDLLKTFYLPDEVCDDFNNTVPGLVDLAGALIMKTKVLEFARYMQPHVPTYLYSFNFKGRKTKLGYGRPVKTMYFDGVAHSDELLYLFPYTEDPTLNEKEKKVVEHITGLWYSFIVNGGKNVSVSGLIEWPAMNTSVGPYLEISDKLNVKNNFVDGYNNYMNQPRIPNSATFISLQNLLFLTLFMFSYFLFAK